MSEQDVLAGWERGDFTSAGITHDTYRKGTGPGVVVIHEIPGITPKVTQFADEVVARGFTVVMPDLMGTPGKGPSAPYIVASMAKLCVAREFAAFALNKTSPVIAWLRALARRPPRPRSAVPVSARSACASRVVSRSG